MGPHRDSLWEAAFLAGKIKVARLLKLKSERIQKMLCQKLKLPKSPPVKVYVFTFGGKHDSNDEISFKKP